MALEYHIELAAPNTMLYGTYCIDPTGTSSLFCREVISTNDTPQLETCCGHIIVVLNENGTGPWSSQYNSSNLADYEKILVRRLCTDSRLVQVILNHEKYGVEYKPLFEGTYSLNGADVSEDGTLYNLYIKFMKNVLDIDDNVYNYGFANLVLKLIPLGKLFQICENKYNYEEIVYYHDNQWHTA